MPNEKEDAISDLIVTYREQAERQASIDFADWLAVNSWEMYDGSGSWIQSQTNKVKPTEVLYNLFLKEKNGR